MNIGVKTIDSQYVINVADHTDTNKSDSIDQHQSKYMYVNRFSPLTVDDDNSIS